MPVALLVLLAFLIGAAPASAGPAMTFTLGRLTASKSCGTPCAEFIVARGEIGFTSVLDYVGIRKRAGERNLPIILESPGGIIGGARLLARLWRDAGLAVVIAHARPRCGDEAGMPPCEQPDARDGVRTYEITPIAHCASSCVILLAGGAHRLATPGAQIGVHRPRMAKDSWVNDTIVGLGVSEREIEKTSIADYADILARYGIDPTLGERAGRTASAEIDWFGRDEARTYRLVNGTFGDLKDFPALAEALRQLEPKPQASSPAPTR